MTPAPQKFTWKRWRRGFVIASLTGLAMGALGLAIDVPLKKAAILFVVNWAKDVLLYLKQHPIESVSDTEPPFRVRLFLMALLALFWTGCASLVSHQVRTEPDGTVTESRLKVRTFLDGKSSVTKARASTTDKTQGLTLSGLEQETEGSNAVSLASEIVGAAVRAAITPK